MLQLIESVAFTFFELFCKIDISQMLLHPLCYYKQTQVVLNSHFSRLRQSIFDILDIKLTSSLVFFLYLRRIEAVSLLSDTIRIKFFDMIYKIPLNYVTQTEFSCSKLTVEALEQQLILLTLNIFHTWF